MSSIPRTVRLALLAVVILPAVPAAAQNRGSFGVREPIVTVVAAPPTGVPGAIVSNTTRQTIDVRVFPTLLAQDLDGTIATQEREDQLGAAARLLTLSPVEFTLEPNREQRVTARWLDTLPGAKAAYLGIVVSGTPQRQTDTGVQFNPRLVQINRLRRPGPYRSRGKFVTLRGEQAGKEKLRFFAGVRNAGEVAEKPERTSFVIHDAAGEDVFRTRWNTETLILPRNTVEFPIDVAEVLPAGKYTAEALMRFGRNPRLEKIEIPFELVGPNLLPTPGLKLGALGATGEPGGPAEIRIPVKSTGTAPVAGKLTVRLFTLDGIKPIATAEADTRELKPEEVQEVELEIGKVEVGNYRVEVLLFTEQGRRLDRASKGFPVLKAKPFFDRFKVPLIAGAGLLALLLLLWFLRRQRSRRKQLEAELEAARAAQPAATSSLPPAQPLPSTAPPPPATAAPVPVPDPVDINAASVAELQRVPGIGPAAAQRIVEHREASGPFASVDDLCAVKGIGPQRVEQLRPHVRV